MTQRAECTDPNCSMAITHYVDEHDRSSVGRDVSWYERRHVQLTRRLANYRRAIKQLQRAHALRESMLSTMTARYHEQRVQNSQTLGELREAQRQLMPRRRLNNRHLAIAFALGAALGFLLGGLMR